MLIEPNLVRLSNIDYDKIAPLRDEFKAKGNSLSLQQFVLVMKKQFNHLFSLIRLSIGQGHTCCMYDHE